MDTNSELFPSQPEVKEPQVLFELIEKALKRRQQQVWRDFKKKHTQFVAWTSANKVQLTHVKNSLTKYILATGFSAAIVTGTVLPNGGVTTTSPPVTNGAATVQTTPMPVPQSSAALVVPVTPLPTPVPAPSSTPDATPKVVTPDQLPQEIQQKMEQYRQWPSEQLAQDISTDVSTLTGVPAKDTLDGHKMNKLFGYFGKEQHLYRYPGDVLEAHAHTDHERATFLPSGIAPGLGAFGYFAPSKTQFTKRDEMREKYYIAAQTFLFPGFYTDKGFKQWLKFKKIIVYNPKNGRAVVGVIGDAGPAQWTGKSFGGSPELMHHLQMVDGKQKGEAIVLFVDDPEDKIPLGPVNYTPEGQL